MALNKGLKDYLDRQRQKKIKEQDKKIVNLRRLKYDEETRQELIENAQYLSRILNRRYQELEKAALEKKSYAYKRTESETGFNRYPTYKKDLSRLSSEELYDLNVDLFAKYASATSVVSEVEEIIQSSLEKAVETLRSNLKYSAPKVAKELTVQNFQTFLKLGGGEFLNEAKDKGYGSNNLIEDWESAKIVGVSDKEFLREWTRFTREFDKDKFKRNIEALKERKRKRKGE